MRLGFLRLGLVLVVSGSAGALWAACSLGDGVTPACDASKKPPDPTACQLTTACDDGRGVVVASPECCGDAATRRFRSCLGTNEAFDSAACMAMPPPGQCTCPGGQIAERDCAIGDACTIWNVCMAGELNGAGGGGGAPGGAGGTAGTGGTGGAGGLGGAGGMGGS